MTTKRTTITGRLIAVERLNSSRYGNPRFALTIDGDNAGTYRTGVDASVGYEVTNHKVGRQISLVLDGARQSVIDMVGRVGE